MMNHARSSLKRLILALLALSLGAALDLPVAYAQEAPAPHSAAAAAPAEQPADAQPAVPVTQPEQPAAETSAAPNAGGDQSTPAPDAEPANDLQSAGAPSATDVEPAGDPAARSPNLPHNLSPWGMFMAADIVVKAVMIGLAFASVVTWTVWLGKSLELTWAKHKLKRAARLLASATSLAEARDALGDRRGPVPGLVGLAEKELSLSAGIADKAGIKERVASRLEGLTLAAGRDMNRGTGLLATIGSTAPFVGLFGTVWGIMNSFIGISETQTTNLAVVAPGIAEALLATAIGLVAAIPAVIVYNQFARAIAGYKSGITEAAAEVERLVSRDLDRGLHAAVLRAAE